MAGLTWTTGNTGLSTLSKVVFNGSLCLAYEDQGSGQYALSTNSGETWTQHNFVVSRRIGRVIVAGGRFFARADDQFFSIPPELHYSDDGVTWTQVSPTPDHTNGVVSFASDGMVLIAGLSDVNSTVAWYRTDPSTLSTWTAIPTPPSDAEVIIGGNGVMFATNYSGELSRSVDAGDTWVEVIAAYALSQSNIEPAHCQNNIWLGPPADPSYPNFIRSTDNGATWAVVANPTGPFTPTENAFIANQFAGFGDTLVAANGYGYGDTGVWYSQDDGDSWTKDDNIGLSGTSTIYLGGSDTALVVLSNEVVSGGSYQAESAAGVVTLQEIEDTPVSFTDTAAIFVTQFVEDTIQLSDTYDAQGSNELDTQIQFSDAITQDAMQLVADSFAFIDEQKQVTEQLVGDTLSFSDTSSTATNQHVTDAILFSDTPDVASSASQELSSTFRLRDALAHASTTETEDSLTLSDTVLASGTMLLADEILLQDTVEQASVTDGDLLEDALLFSDEHTVQVEAQAYVEDTLLFTDDVFYKNPGAVAWVMNTETGAPSWYSNWQFVDMIQAGDKVLAVGPEGLVELGADVDEGEVIDAHIEYGFVDFGVDQKKRVDSFWFGYTSSDVLEVTVETYGQGYPVYTYSMEPRTAEQARNNRVRPGKALNARYWRVGVHNLDGCSFDVDSVGADVATSGRRV